MSLTVGSLFAGNSGSLTGRLDCEECRTGYPITVDDSARYLARGWPKCCGSTMKWTPNKPGGTPDTSGGSPQIQDVK